MTWVVTSFDAVSEWRTLAELGEAGHRVVELVDRHPQHQRGALDVAALVVRGALAVHDAADADEQPVDLGAGGVEVVVDQGDLAGLDHRPHRDHGPVHPGRALGVPAGRVGGRLRAPPRRRARRRRPRRSLRPPERRRTCCRRHRCRRWSARGRPRRQPRRGSGSGSWSCRCDAPHPGPVPPEWRALPRVCESVTCDPSRPLPCRPAHAARRRRRRRDRRARGRGSGTPAAARRRGHGARGARRRSAASWPCARSPA